MKKYFGLGALLIFFIVIGIAFILPVQYDGTEFCPQTFEIRSFDYSKSAVGPGNMHRYSPAVAGGSSITKYLQPPGTVLRWDLATGGARGSWQEADANVLVQYLQAGNWKTSWNLSNWSDEHPEIAAELWPKVQWLAIHNLYFAIPKLIRHAQSEPTLDQFMQFADQHTVNSAIQQTEYLLTLQLSRDKEILLVRLVGWLAGQSNMVASMEDDGLTKRYEAVVDQAKSRVQGLQDGTLSNEESAPTLPSTTTSGGTPTTGGATPSVQVP
jgi:hypothetical protein